MKGIIAKNIFKFSVVVMLLILAGGNSQTAFASSVSTLNAGKIYCDYDITGDGKADTLKTKDIKTIYDGDDAYGKFEVYINEKCALTLKDRYYSSTVKLLSLDNGKIYLYVNLSGDNGDGPSALYACQNGKLKKEADFVQSFQYMGYHNGGDIHDVKGNKIVVRMGSMSYGLASVEFEAVYQYKNGKLVLQSKTHKIIEYYNQKKSVMGRTKLTTSGKLQLYKTKKVKKKTWLLPKGTKVYVTKCYVSGKTVSYLVKTSGGKTGWFRSKETMNEPPFNEIVYAG